MIVHLGQILDGFQSRNEMLGLSRGAPVNIRFSAFDENVQSDDTNQSDESSDIAHEKHDCDAQNCTEKTDPFVVIFETWPPSCQISIQ